jgi:hypothetical protein
MSQGAVTIANAPRDADKLQIIGPYMLKLLMEQASKKMNIAWTEERKGAFLKDPIDKRAKDVLEMLHQIDKAEGGAPAEAPPPAAAAPKEEKPKRDPKPASTANGTANGTNGTGGHEGDGMAVLQGIASVIKEVSSSLDAMQKTVANVEKGSKRIDALEGKVEQMFRLQHLTMAVLLQMAENQLGATSQQILEGAAGDYGPAEAIISKMIAGK